MTPRNVEIVVKGELSGGLETELHDAVVTVIDGVTSVRLVARDASALFAVLYRLQAQGMELLAVHWLDDTPPQ